MGDAADDLYEAEMEVAMSRSYMIRTCRERSCKKPDWEPHPDPVFDGYRCKSCGGTFTP